LQIKEAQFNDDLCLANGRGVGIDSAGAAHYWELASDQGFAEARFSYGWCLMGCLGIAPDIATAMHDFRNSADNDSAINHLLFAFLLDNGIGISSDLIMAVKYYESGARSLPSACAFYGWRLSMRKGVPVNFMEAAELFQRAPDFNIVWSIRTCLNLV
jgi:TPR repeat protein